MNSRKIIEGLGPLIGKRHRPISKFARSWADQEATRERKPITPEQERQRRAGLVHPDIANAPVLKGYEKTDARGNPVGEGDSQFRRPSYAHIDPFAGAGRDVFRQQRIASPEGKRVQQHLGMRQDDMGMPVGKGGMRRFPTNAPGEGGGGPGSTAGILLGQAGYAAWARDMHERGNPVPTWDEGTPYAEEALSPRGLVDQLIETWQQRVQEVYDSFEELEAFDQTYGIVSRLGFPDAATLWDANPVISGSTDPRDLKVVAESKSPAARLLEYALGGDEE